MRIASNGAVGIQTIGEGITNNYLSAGALTIGNTTQDYGGGITSWNSNTAGFLMECLNNTEIAVHDSGNSIHSFMRYTNNGNFRIGRDIFPKPQIMGFLLHELIPLELKAKYPDLWRGDISRSDKDIVYIPDDFFSIEVKTSSDPRHI
jgi:hypothetical protein